MDGPEESTYWGILGMAEREETIRQIYEKTGRSESTIVSGGNEEGILAVLCVKLIDTDSKWLRKKIIDAPFHYL